MTLFFQEQIQGLKNASIARFDGLGCYQTNSEKAVTARAAYGLPAPRRSVKARTAQQPNSGGQTAAARATAGQQRF